MEAFATTRRLFATTAILLAASGQSFIMPDEEAPDSINVPALVLAGWALGLTSVLLLLQQ
jgi:hypothetical protein